MHRLSKISGVMSNAHLVPATLLAAVLLGGAAAPDHAASVTLVNPLDAHASGMQETSFGDFAADAVLAAAPDADFALLPAGELHAVTVPTGSASGDLLVQALRTGGDAADVVVAMKLTGAQVREALAHGLSREPSPYDGFLQVSGMTVVYDPAKHGAARVEKVTVIRTQAALDESATYTVAMPRYLADGALGYFQLWAGAEKYKTTGTSLAGAVSAYAAAHQPLAYAASANRIKAEAAS